MRTFLPLLKNSLTNTNYLLFAASIGAIATLAYHGLQKNQYQATATLKLNQIQTSTQDQHLAHQSGAQQLSLEALTKRIKNPEIATTLPWWFELHKEALGALSNDKLEKTNDLEAAKIVLSNVQTSIAKDNLSFDISFVAHDPTLAPLIANAIARSAIIDANRVQEEKRSIYITFLQEQIQSAEKQLQESIEKLGSVANSIDAWNKKQSSEQRITALESALKQLVEERIELETKLKSKTNTSKEIGEHEYQLALQQRLLEIDLSISIESKQLGPKHPKMLSLRAERKRVTQLLDKQIRSAHSDAGKVIAALGAQEDALRREILSIRASKAKFEQESKSYADAKSELASLQDSKKWWSTQLAYAKTQRGSFASPLSLHIPASISTRPLNPMQYSSVLLSALFTALIAWIVKLYTLSQSKKFVSIQHAQTYLGTEPVAVLPLVEGLYIAPALDYDAKPKSIESQKFYQLEEAQVISEQNKASVATRELTPTSISQESANLETPLLHLLPKMIVSDSNAALLVPSELSHSFRHLQNRLTFQLPPSASTIAITSAIPFEGKSTVASQLAVSMAKAGYKTVLVDASVISAASRHRIPGLAEYLNNELKIEDVLVCSATPGLWNIGAGNCCEETRSLIYSKEFKSLLTNLRSRFESIIIDCPALSLAAESLYIADRADAFLLISDFELGDRYATKLALTQLEKTNSINAGLVLNRYDIGHCGIPEQMSVLAG